MSVCNFTCISSLSRLKVLHDVTRGSFAWMGKGLEEACNTSEQRSGRPFSKAVEWTQEIIRGQTNLSMFFSKRRISLSLPVHKSSLQPRSA